MAASNSSFIPTPLAHADNQGEGHQRGAPLHWRPMKFNLYNPKVRGANGFSVLPEEYFSGSENVNEFLEGIDNQIRLLEIPSDLSCAYLKGHLLGRAQKWYQICGSALMQNTTTDFAQLKMAWSKTFPAIRNKKDLEIKFYASQQRKDQEATDFIYDLLKLHKKTRTGDMCKEALVDLIFVRLEPKVQDYVEAQNPQNTVQLLEVLSKFEERYSQKTMKGSRNSDNVERQRGNYENGRQGNQWFDSKNRFQRDDRRFNDRGYQFRNGGQNDDFSRVDRKNRRSSENFSRGDRRQRGRLNVLKVNDDQNYQTQSANEVPIKLSAICMSPVELPYVPILLNDTFTKALWDTGVEKSFILEEVYPLVPVGESSLYRLLRANCCNLLVNSLKSVAIPYGWDPFRLLKIVKFTVHLVILVNIWSARGVVEPL
ncbi:uncharacterized protein TNCV_4036911 [Trichonephila clavipes]|nr:uncharacterized protein TNCV_4036911 [Trichonephila clavipes]